MKVSYCFFIYKKSGKGVSFKVEKEKYVPGKELVEYLENETPEQKKQRIYKASQTRMRNTRDRKMLERAVLKALNTEYLLLDDKGKKVRKTGVEQIAANLVREAMKEDGRNVVSAFAQIEKTLGETKSVKSELKVEAPQLEAFLNPVLSDEEY